MLGKNPDAGLKCGLALPVVALGLAGFLGPVTAEAQSSSEVRREPFQNHSVDSSERRKRDAAEKREQTQAQQREAAAKRQRETEERHQRDAEERRRRETTQRDRPPAKHTGQQAYERERANERRAAERREKHEREEILRRQDAMRRADEERAAARRQQDARWADEMRRRDAGQGVQPASRGPYSLPNAYGTPAPSGTPQYTASGGTTCSAHPTCPADSGYGNVCKSVSRSYGSSGAGAAGMQDIVNRCQAANSPDPCSAKSRMTFGGGCAQQCASAARCTTAAAR